MSSVILEAWHERTPLIVGLESHYTIGQRITLNCTVPALHSHIPNPMGTLYWLMNGHKVGMDHFGIQCAIYLLL